MSGLLYRPDADEVRQRLTTWWDGGDIGRPPLLITIPRQRPIETFEPVPEPREFFPPYDWRDLNYRIHYSRLLPSKTVCLGECLPCVAPDLGPDCLALYLGCKGIPAPGTTWFEPCIDDPDRARLEFDPDNFYWQTTLRLARELRRVSRGRCLLQFPDLIEGLDTLSAMRGNEAMLFDLVERPAWVRACMDRIVDLYFRYYDRLYDLLRDEVGGSNWWMWAPGRLSKLQCDFSAMIGPDMFKEFMVPLLTEMAERCSYSIYHWDGPSALVHKPHLLSIPGIQMIQWQPGAGAAPIWDKTWWPLYHEVLDAGKKLMIVADSIESLKALKREFGRGLKRCAIIMVQLRSEEQAREAMRAAEV